MAVICKHSCFALRQYKENYLTIIPGNVFLFLHSASHLPCWWKYMACRKVSFKEDVQITVPFLITCLEFPAWQMKVSPHSVFIAFKLTRKKSYTVQLTILVCQILWLLALHLNILATNRNLCIWEANSSTTWLQSWHTT